MLYSLISAIHIDFSPYFRFIVKVKKGKEFTGINIFFLLLVIKKETFPLEYKFVQVKSKYNYVEKQKEYKAQNRFPQAFEERQI